MKLSKYKFKKGACKNDIAEGSFFLPHKTNSKKSDKGKIIESVKKQEFYDKFLLNDSKTSNA